MSKFKCQGFCNTFKNARKGIRLALKAEDNIKFHYVIALFVLFTAVLLEFSATKICVLLITIAMVIITEMLNSALEFGLDAIFKNKYNKLVGMAKDISAGAVLVATAVAMAVGVILFGDALL